MPEKLYKITGLTLYQFKGIVVEITIRQDQRINNAQWVHPPQTSMMITQPYVRFLIQNAHQESKEFAFSNANFDFREGHLISVLTSKRNYHRLIINHNTGRFWFPNVHKKALMAEPWHFKIGLKATAVAFLSLVVLLFLYKDSLINLEFTISNLFGYFVLISLPAFLFFWTKHISSNQLVQWYQQSFQEKLRTLAKEILNKSA